MNLLWLLTIAFLFVLACEVNAIGTDYPKRSRKFSEQPMDRATIRSIFARGLRFTN